MRKLRACPCVTCRKWRLPQVVGICATVILLFALGSSIGYILPHAVLLETMGG